MCRSEIFFFSRQGRPFNIAFGSVHIKLCEKLVYADLVEDRSFRRRTEIRDDL